MQGILQLENHSAESALFWRANALAAGNMGPVFGHLNGVKFTGLPSVNFPARILK
jgi:hypothetical protein